MTYPRSHRSRPPSPPFFPTDSHLSNNNLNKDEDDGHLLGFFTVPPTPELTPPPSLPISPPNSPSERKVRAKLRLSAERGSVTGGSDKGKSPATSFKKSRISKKKSEGALYEVVRDEERLPAAYNFEPQTSPILPKVKLSFPTLFSSGEDEGEDDGGDGFSWQQRGGERQRTWSHKTTVKRTEHRSWKYSMPSLPLFEPELDSGGIGGGSPTKTSRPNSTRSTRHSFPGSQSTPYASGSSSWTASPSSSTTHSRESSNQDGEMPSSFSSHRFYSTYPSSSDTPSFFSSINSTPTTPTPPSSRLRSRKSRHPSSAPPSSSSSSSDANHPFLNVFFLAVVAAITCCSIGAVLLAGFSLTFYDDCYKRLGEGHRLFRGSIEGVRHGVGKALGGAKDALDLVVKVGVKQIKAAESVMHRAAPGGDGGIKRPTVGASGGVGIGGSFQRGRSRTRRRKSSSPFLGRVGGEGGRSSPRPSPLQRDQQPQQQNASPTNSNKHEISKEWMSDEDGLPYDVPHPTPHTSRTSSPHRDRDRSRGNGNGNQRPILPPRPPLIYLLPSILVALLYTMFKLFQSVWLKSKQSTTSTRTA